MGDLARINTNVAAQKIYHQLSQVNQEILAQQEKIATGKTINRAADNPASYYAARKLELDLLA